MEKQELKILVPIGMLGYGVPIAEFKKGLEMNPDAISVDSGSTDSGPHKLALGHMTCSREAYLRDMEILIKGAREYNIPLLISSAGGDGSNEHVDLFVDIAKEIAIKQGLKLKIATIYSNVDKVVIAKKLSEGKVIPCGPAPTLDTDEIDRATVVVAQMGVEPFLRVFDEQPDVDLVIAGRAYDPAPIAALPLKHGFDPGLTWHMGKILECGALCAEPAGKAIMGTLKRDHFIVEPINPDVKCTTYSVAAHTLYEKSHPYLLPGPGGVLDLSQATFEQYTERSVKVSGSRFNVSKGYTVKLEGAKTTGYRSICIAGARDPIFISQIDDFLGKIQAYVKNQIGQVFSRCQLIFHVYGKNGVMGDLEPIQHSNPLELCIVIETVAPSPELATEICNKARIALLHGPYEGRMATGGNVAFPFTPLEIPIGQMSEFNVYHLMEIDDPVSLFPIKYMEV